MNTRQNEVRNDQETSEQEVVPDCFRVRYQSEANDIAFLVERYNAGTFLRLKGHIGEVRSASVVTGRVLTADVIRNRAKPLLRPFFPRLYHVAELTLERLGLVGNIEVYLRNYGNDYDGPSVAYEVDEDNGTAFLFVLTAEDVERYDDDELAFFFGGNLARRFWHIDYLMGLEQAPEEGMPKDEEVSVLPRLGNDFYRRWVAKSRVSEDRVGAMAAGGFVAAARALLKKNFGISARNMAIPCGDESFDTAESLTGGGVPSCHSIPFRLMALRLFCREWFSPARASAALERADVLLDQFFAAKARNPLDEEQKMMMFLIADLGYEMLTQDGIPTDQEIRCLLHKILEFTDDPLAVLNVSPADRKKRIRNFTNKYEEHVDSFLEVLDALIHLALLSGPKAENRLNFVRRRVRCLKNVDQGDLSKVEELIEQVRTLGDEEFVVDPLMDELVERVKLRWDGRQEGPLKSRRVKRCDDVDESLDVLRYTGDRETERLLRDVYHVESYLASWRNISANQESSRASTLRETVELTEAVSPRVVGVVRKVLARLRYQEPFDVYCQQSLELNACATRELSGGTPRGIIRITSAALEALDDDELAYLIGHEMGHLIFKNNEMGFLSAVEDEDSYVNTLPLLGDIKLRKWQQMKEISADRMGLWASRDLAASLRASIKVAYGLSERNLSPGAVDALLRQLESIKDHQILEGDDMLSHPLNQLRLKALQLFGMACEKADYNLETLRQGEVLEKVDQEISGWLQWLRKYPRTPSELAAMQVFATAAVNLVESDGQLDEREIREILDMLVRRFTEEPLEELVVSRQDRNARLKEACLKLAKFEDDDLKQGVMWRLVSVALADGCITVQEQDYLEKIAHRIGYAAFDFQSLEEEVVQKLNFPVDFLLEDMVKEVRRLMSTGSI